MPDTPKQLLFRSEREPDWAALEKGCSLLDEGLYSEGLSILRDLSDQGSFLAPVYIGQALEQRPDLAGENDTALKWYLKSAELGSATGQFMLASLHRRRGDEAEALIWYERAADQGLVPAMYWLSQLLSRNGADKARRIRAEAYLYQAAQAGHVFARKKVAKEMFQGKFGLFGRLKGLVLLIGYAVQGVSKIARHTEPDLLY